VVWQRCTPRSCDHHLALIPGAISVGLTFLCAARAFAQSTHTLSAASCVIAHDFDVFVDPPTGPTFVKLPSRCKFVGKVEQEQLAKLPPTVLTSLLPNGEDRKIPRSEAAFAK